MGQHTFRPRSLLLMNAAGVRASCATQAGPGPRSRSKDYATECAGSRARTWGARGPDGLRGRARVRDSRARADSVGIKTGQAVDLPPGRTGEADQAFGSAAFLPGTKRE